MVLQFSLSAYQAWQRCEQNYFYGYVERLRPLVKDLAPQRGAMLHEWLAEYYRTLKTGGTASDARAAAYEVLLLQQPVIAAGRQAAFLAGDMDLAQQYDELLPAVTRIASRYYHVRGEQDASQYDVLMVEQSIRIRIAPGITSVSVIDLVLRDREDGRIWLTEHKSTTSVPDSSVRLRDLQTLLYAEVLDQTMGIRVDGVLWNYMRTKEPVEPYVLKNGGLSRSKDVDTTWPVYRRALIANGLNEEDYADMRGRLIRREEEVYFPRYEHVIVTEPQMLLSDYIDTAKEVKNKSSRWRRGLGRPLRSLTRDCNWCQYYRLCEAAITGGDVEDVKRMRFRQSSQEKKA